MSPAIDPVLEWLLLHRLASVGAASSFALLLGSLLHLGGSDPATSPQRTTSVAMQVVGSLGLAVFAAIAATRDHAHNRWGDLLALVPAALIARHAIYLRMVRRRAFALDGDAGGRELETEGFEKRKFAQIFRRARTEHDREFRVDVLTIRYGTPAILLVAVGIAQAELLGSQDVWDMWTSTNAHNALVGARFASIGALTYTLLYLGQRSVRRDLTSGAAVWSVVTMTIGPILGGVIALLWNGTTPGSEWSYDAIYFVTGLAPRYAASAVEETVRRLWLTRTGPTSPPPQTVALTCVRGVSTDIEDRLAEEGITDAYALAMADPLKLYRNTAFDKRQILSWMDEALLAVFFPDDWQDLRKADVTGVIDLATKYGRVRKSVARAGDEFDLLEKRLNDPALPAAFLRNVASILYEDAQVELIWALYQVNDDGIDGSGGDAGGFDARRLMTPAVPRGVGASMAVGVTWSLVAAAAAALLWTTPWPVDSAGAWRLAACALAGAALACVLDATVFDPAADWARRRPPAIAAIVLLVLAAVVWAMGGQALTTVGKALLGLAAVALGWSAAWAIIARVSRVTVAIGLVPGDLTDTVVSIDAATIPGTGGRYALVVARGPHELSVRCPGHRQVKQWFHTSALRRGSLEVRLEKAATGILPRVQPDADGLTVTATPVGGGAPVACTGFTALPSGAWVVEASAPDFKTSTVLLDLDEGQRPELPIELKRRKALVTVKAPPGAQLVALSVDGVSHSAAGDTARVKVRTGERELFAQWEQAGAPRVAATKRVRVTGAETIIQL